MKNGYLSYRKRGVPTGYFSLYLQFKPKSNDANQLLRHSYNGCTTVQKCTCALALTITDGKLHLTVNHSDSADSLVTDYNTIKVYSLQTDVIYCMIM